MGQTQWSGVSPAEYHAHDNGKSMQVALEGHVKYPYLRTYVARSTIILTLKFIARIDKPALLDAKM